MKKFFKRLSVILFALSIVLYSGIGYLAYQLPDHILVNENCHEIKINEYDFLKATAVDPVSSVNRVNNNHYKAKLSLFGLLPVEAVEVYAVKESNVTVLGLPFGIKIYTDGVMIVDFTDVKTARSTRNPCKEAGVQVGDVLLAINGERVYENRTVAAVIAENRERPLDFLIQRKESEMHFTVIPIEDEQGDYKIGIWIRDSTAGIGTLTFCDEEGTAAGLGHGICDVDTGELVDVLYGEFMEAQIISVQKGTDGMPGELKGVFRSRVLGKILSNNITGIYGKVQSVDAKYIYPIAPKQEVESGKAKLLTTIDGNGPCFYECEIKKINFNDESQTQNFILQITDPILIEKTGGIVQGMSGSPILQNGKLVGAVTHVFVNDSTKGYGIFAENMQKTAEQLEKAPAKAS